MFPTLLKPTRVTSSRARTEWRRVAGGASGSLTCDGRVAAGALVGVEVAETPDAVRTVPLRREGLSGQRSAAAAAQEAVFMPNLLLELHASFGHGLQNQNRVRTRPQAGSAWRFDQEHFLNKKNNKKKTEK